MYKVGQNVMNNYQVQKVVQTETTTDIYDVQSFNSLEAAQAAYQEVLKKQDVYAGEYYENEGGDYWEDIEIVDQDCETIQSERVYFQGRMDKNNYRGNYPVWYWAIGKHNGNEMVYNFYENGVDFVLAYENITNLDEWYNYARKKA